MNAPQSERRVTTREEWSRIWWEITQLPQVQEALREQQEKTAIGSDK